MPVRQVLEDGIFKPRESPRDAEPGLILGVLVGVNCAPHGAALAVLPVDALDDAIRVGVVPQLGDDRELLGFAPGVGAQGG